MSSEALSHVRGAARPDDLQGDLAGAIESFLVDRRVRNCTARTLETYQRNLERFAAAVGWDLAACTPLAVQRYLIGLRVRMQPVTIHQHFRTLRTFFTWCTASGLLADDPVRGLTMRPPKTLPRVPEDDEVRQLLAACSGTFEGVRNLALVALLADSALRISEALQLRIGDVSFITQTLRIRQGKGQQDGVGFFGAKTAACLRAWLSLRPDRDAQAIVFVTRDGRPLTRYRAAQIRHRLSMRARLAREVGPHALRHFAATALLRQTGDLELVRQVLRHATLAMTLRYARLAAPEVAARFVRASPVDHLAPHASSRRHCNVRPR